MKRVCFGCRTVYHLFIAYILSITIYKQEHRILLISELINNAPQIFENLKKMNLWENVILTSDSSNQKLNEEIQSNQLLEIDIFHFFSWGSLSSRKLFNQFSDSVKIILTEEGSYTYKPVGSYSKWHDSLVISSERENLEYAYTLNLEKISEVWLLYPELFDNSLKRPVKKIQLLPCESSKLSLTEIVRDLKKIFSFDNQGNNWRVLFFDTYLTYEKMISYECEKKFLNNLVGVLNGYHFLIKKHPNEPGDFTKLKYQGLNVHFLENSSVPWEIMYLDYLTNLNNDEERVVLATCFSTAVFNSLLIDKQLGKQSCYVILLYKLIQNYVISDSFQEHTEYINNFIKKYPSDRIFIPETFTELDHILKLIFGEKSDPEKDGQAKQLAEVQSQLSWFQTLYAKNYKYIPDSLCWNYFLLDYGDGYLDSPLSQVTDVSAETFMISLKNMNLGLIKKIRWIPFYHRVLFSIADLKITITDSSACQEMIHLDHCLTNGILQSNGTIKFETANPYIEFEVNKIITEISFTGAVYFNDSYIEHFKIIETLENRNQHVNVLELQIKISRLQQYYVLMNNWVKIHQKKKTLGSNLVPGNRVMIYGAGEIGKNLRWELEETGIRLVCFIVQKRAPEFTSFEKLPVFSIDEIKANGMVNDIDLIIVTPVYDFENIKHNLEKYQFNCKIISIESLINNYLEED